MFAIVCLDDRKGMMFNGRRQSRDRVVTQKILELAKDSRLWIHPFSEPLFAGATEENITVDEDFPEKAGKGEFCFVENLSLEGMKEKLEGIVVFWWNRHYPSDMRLDISFEGWKKTGEEEFAGHSHPVITKEVYMR